MGSQTRTSGIARVFTNVTQYFISIKSRNFLDESSYLGASPDGIVVDEAGHSIKLVEVKCPFSARDMTVKEACTEAKSLYCNIINNKCQLKVNHEYYFQVMGQMAITGVHTRVILLFGLLKIFMCKQSISILIYGSIPVCLNLSTYFFFMLPEILYPNLSSSQDYSNYKCMYTNF